jgi:hypothetical protein
MNRTLPFLAAALAALLAACGGQSEADPFAAATPDVAGLTLETTGGAGDGLAPAGRALTEVAAAAASCEPYQYLCNIQKAVADLNAFVKAAVAPVETLVAGGAGVTVTPVGEHVKVYEADLPEGAAITSYRLTVLRLGPGEAHGAGAIPVRWQWKLEAKRAADAATSYVAIMAGGLKRVEKEDRPHRGRGTLGIDLDAWATVVDGFPARGKLLASFAHVGGHKSLAYVLKEFQADPASDPVRVGVLVGHKNEGGPARVRLASLKEWLAPAPGAADAGDEMLVSRAVWLPGVGGRAAVVVSGGDVPGYSSPGLPRVDYFLGVSCYDVQRDEFYRELLACSRTGVTSDGKRCEQYAAAPAGFNVGDRSLCALRGDDLCDGDHPPPAIDPWSHEPEPGTPALPDLPPTSMPGF